ncbi:MAG: AraC family transcriptional regulator [Gemmatimonadaceae bacterium]|nr:AraC family transcriptional regulator [Gemmatimonadaceae bacterium]
MHAAFTIGLLASSADAAPRLREAARGRAQVAECASIEQLVALVADGAVSLAVVEVRRATAADQCRAIRQLQAHFPAHPVVAWADLRELPTALLLELAALRVIDVLRGDAEHLPSALVRAIGAALQRTVAVAIAQAVGDLIPPRLTPVFEYVLEHVNDRLDRDQLAATFGISRRTLHNRLVEAGLPPTRAFLTWCRVFVAVALLEQPGHTLDSVAGQLDFGDGGVLANTVRRYAGAGIAELRAQGALAAAARAFREQVRAARAAPGAAARDAAAEPVLGD